MERHPNMIISRATTPLADRLNFQPGFASLFQAFKTRTTVAMTKEFVALGLNAEKLDAAYAHATFFAAVDIFAKNLFAGEPLEQCFQKIGFRLVETYFETIWGKPLLVLLKLMGPKRTLLRMKQNFRTTNNYAESELVETAEGEYQLWMNELGNARFTSWGILQRGLTLSTNKEVKVDMIYSDEFGTVFSIRF